MGKTTKVFRRKVFRTQLLCHAMLPLSDLVANMRIIAINGVKNFFRINCSMIQLWNTCLMREVKLIPSSLILEVIEETWTKKHSTNNSRSLVKIKIIFSAAIAPPIVPSVAQPIRFRMANSSDPLYWGRKTIYSKGVFHKDFFMVFKSNAFIKCRRIFYFCTLQFFLVNLSTSLINYRSHITLIVFKKGTTDYIFLSGLLNVLRVWQRSFAKIKSKN